MRLSRALRKKRPQYEQRHEKVILQHDNLLTNIDRIASSDYNLFPSMAHGLADQEFRSYKDIEKWLHS